MKTVLLLLLFTWIGCQDYGVEPRYGVNFDERDIVDFHGFIQEVSTTLYVIAPDGYFGTPETYFGTPETFIPLYLSPAYRVNGLHVIVSGRTKVIPLSVAYPGTPLEISSISIRQ